MKKLLILLIILFLTVPLFSQTLSDYTFGQKKSAPFYKQSKEFIIWYPIMPIGLRPSIEIPKKEPLYYECDYGDFLRFQLLPLTIRLEFFDKPFLIRRNGLFPIYKTYIE